MPAHESLQSPEFNATAIKYGKEGLAEDYAAEALQT